MGLPLAESQLTLPPLGLRFGEFDQLKLHGITGLELREGRVRHAGQRAQQGIAARGLAVCRKDNGPVIGW